MKHTLLIIMVLLSSLLFSQQREVVVDRYFNGTKELIIVYEGEGINESLVRKLEYYENEKIKSSTDWKDGKPNGTVTYWNKTGEKLCEGVNQNGMLFGEYTFYNKDGSLKEPINYDLLLELGISMRYPDKEIFSGKVYKNYSRGKREYESSYLFGQINGKITKWNENGQKEEEVYYKDGKIFEWTSWDEDGNVKYIKKR